MDRKLFNVSKDIQFDHEKTFAASPEDQKYQSFPKLYIKFTENLSLMSILQNVSKGPYDLLESQGVS